METKPENQDGVWDGEGPQPAAPSPTVTCEFEHAPDQCSFPMCDCAGMSPQGDVTADDLRMTNGDPVAAISTAHEALALAEPFPDPTVKRQPKRDRAKYMRVYRAQQKSARTR